MPPSFVCPKDGARKGHPTVPVLWSYQHTKLLMIDTLCFLLLTGRWKLTACGGSDRSSVLFRQRLWCSAVQNGLTNSSCVLLPYHAAEQRSKERISDSAERMRLSDVARSLWIAQGSPPLADQVNGCLFFWFVFFGQAKKMNIKNIYPMLPVWHRWNLPA